MADCLSILFAHSLLCQWYKLHDESFNRTVLRISLHNSLKIEERGNSLHQNQLQLPQLGSLLELRVEQGTDEKPQVETWFLCQRGIRMCI